MQSSNSSKMVGSTSWEDRRPSCTHKGVEHDRKVHGRGPYTKINCALCDAVLMPELLEPALEPDLQQSGFEFTDAVNGTLYWSDAGNPFENNGTFL